MDLLLQHLPELALAAALAWASGMRLYFVLFLVGLAGRYGGVELPPHLQILANPLVLAASGFMVFTEFFADKIPLVDSLWDAAHTFIRIPAGAALAAAVMGDSGTSAALAAAIIGGGLAASSHFAKSGGRALINASPEPLSNWAASLSEDVLVVAALWTAFHHPLLFIGALILFLVAVLWLMRILWRSARSLFNRRTDPPGYTPGSSKP